MPFNVKDFYELAQWLVDQRKDESSLRTAISRIYYAAHLIALQKLIQKGWTPTGRGKDHDGVIRELRSRRFRNQGDQLKSLLELREHADYHVDTAQTIRNQYCEFCKKVRDSQDEQNVNIRHWEEALSIGNRCMPHLEKL